MGQFWAGCCGWQTVGSTPDEKSFYGVAKRPDGRTMVPLSRPKRKFQLSFKEPIELNAIHPRQERRRLSVSKGRPKPTIVFRLRVLGRTTLVTRVIGALA